MRTLQDYEDEALDRIARRQERINAIDDYRRMLVRLNQHGKAIPTPSGMVLYTPTDVDFLALNAELREREELVSAIQRDVDYLNLLHFTRVRIVRSKIGPSKTV